MLLFSCLKRGYGPSYEQTWIFVTQEFFSQVCLKFTLWFWKRNTIEIFNSFSLFCRYLLSEKGVALHLKNLVLVVSVRGSEEKFKRSCMYFHYSVSISPRKRRGLSFEDTLIHFDHSLSEDNLCLVPLTLAPWFWKRIFLKCLHAFYYFAIISH